MGKLDNGILGPFRGKVANIIGYELNGQNIIRIEGHKNKKLSIDQLNNCLQMAVIVEFLDPMKSFLKTAFNPVAKGTTKNYHNIAVSSNKPNALSGYYPEVEMDYTRVILSTGTLSVAENPTVERIGDELKFTWEMSQGAHWTENDDQVMLMAYAPRIKKCCFVKSGARRTDGKEVLKIKTSMKNELLETYISFVSDDRQRVANSQYTGQVSP